jgi:transposase
MANLLKMALIETICSLHQRGWSQRRIARELGIHRETVARHLLEPPPSKPANAPPGSEAALHDSKPANAPPGSEAALHDSKPPLVPFGSTLAEMPWADDPEAGVPLVSESVPQAFVGPVIPARGRQSVCEPWRSVIEAKLALELSAQRIYQDLVSEHGFAGNYYNVRRFVARLQPRHALPVRRLECLPGEEAQVDFGTGAWIRSAEGKRRRSHVLRVVLSHSRKAYSQAVLRQTTDNFLRCLEDAFWHFGGVPRRLVLDNLKAGVLQADWFDPELNPRFASFCQHYAIVPWPLRPRRPEHKGKVERGVAYVQDNALKAREFTSLEEQNCYLLEWEKTVADTRIHGTTRQQVGAHFAAVERPTLQALPVGRFPFFREGQRTVNRDGHIEVDHAYYSVAPEFLGRRVWVRWDGRLVRIFNEHMEPITTHAQREAGRFSTQRQHIAAEKISAVEHGAVYLLTRLRRLGSEVTAWAEAVMATRGVEGMRVLQGLWGLTKKYNCEHIARACAAAHSHGSYRLRTVRALLERPEPGQPALPFLDEHPLIRPLADYERFIHQAFHKEKQA